MPTTIDFNTPALTDNYSTAFVPNLLSNFRSLGAMLDPNYVTAPTNALAGAKRLNSTTLLFEQFNGTSWAELVMGYAKKSGAVFTGAVSGPNFDGVLGGVTPAAATVTTLNASGAITGVQGIFQQAGLAEVDVFYRNNALNRFYHFLNAAGDTFGLAYSDNLGAYLGVAFSVARATGRMSINAGVDVSGGAGNAFTTSGSTATLSVIDSGANGANLKFVGNGVTTPNKFIRVYNGNMEWANSAYSAVIATLTDAGAFTVPGLLKGNGLDASGASIVNVGNIFGSATGSAYTLGAEPVGSFNNGANLQVYGSTAGGIPGYLVLAAGASVGQIDFKTGNATRASILATGPLKVNAGAYTPTNAVAFSATPTINFLSSNFAAVGTMTLNVTSVTITNATESQFVSVRWTQDATGGRTMTTGNMGATNPPKVSGTFSTAPNVTTYATYTYNAAAARYDIFYSQVN